MHWAGHNSEDPREMVTLPQIETYCTRDNELSGTWDLLGYLRYFPLPNRTPEFSVAFCVCSAVYSQHMQNRVAVVFLCVSANHILLRALFKIHIPECPVPDSPGFGAWRDAFPFPLQVAP